MTADVLLEPALPEGVVRDLHGLLDAATDGLRSAGCLLVYGGLGGQRLSIDVNGGLGTLMELVAHTRPSLAYVDAGAWTADELAEHREDLADSGLSAAEVVAATAALDEASCHLGEYASLRLSVVAGGVVHDFTFFADWSFRATEHELERAGASASAREAYLERERAERLRLQTLLVELTDALVADEPFLRLNSEGTRRTRANELAGPFFGAEHMTEQPVRGAIAEAVRSATARRAEHVVPVRVAALRERIPDLAAVLAGDPEFCAERTTAARERCARGLLNREDPVVPAAPLVHALVTAALARQGRPGPGVLLLDL